MCTVFRLWFCCDFPSSHLDGCPNVSIYIKWYTYTKKKHNEEEAVGDSQTRVKQEEC